jgi:hypothetical protein
MLNFELKSPPGQYSINIRSISCAGTYTFAALKGCGSKPATPVVPLPPSLTTSLYSLTMCSAPTLANRRRNLDSSVKLPACPCLTTMCEGTAASSPVYSNRPQIPYDPAPRTFLAFHSLGRPFQPLDRRSHSIWRRMEMGFRNRAAAAGLPVSLIRPGPALLPRGMVAVSWTRNSVTFPQVWSQRLSPPGFPTFLFSKSAQRKPNAGTESSTPVSEMEGELLLLRFNT